MLCLASTLRRLTGPVKCLLPSFKTVLSRCLVKLFRRCLSLSTFPAGWKFANKQPVLQKGDRSNPLNNSPVATLSSLFKALY